MPITPLILLFAYVIFIGFLLIEAVTLRRKIRRIPLRISVSGTRGKTSTVRMLASVLRESGRMVLAKTTGSAAMYILPDGSEVPVRRVGFPNIIEQKKLIRKGVESKIDCLVAEIMSIQPENHRTETRHLLRPHLTLITNYHPDHLDATGYKKDAMKVHYQNDLWRGGKVIVGDMNPLHSWSESNRDLVWKAAKYLDIGDAVIEQGIRMAKMDIGYPLVLTLAKSPHPLLFVNAFAANDPLSTSLLMKQILPTMPISNPSVIALLSLRADRGERSEQWMKYLSAEGKNLYEKIYLTGVHSKILHRKLDRTILLKGDDPDEILQQIIENIDSPTVCFGIGNIHGPGLSIITRAKGESLTRTK